MARVLQIRRGTTAQNDNFTGLAGELSFDTESNTVRIHDGVRLGGYTLARTDQIPDPNTSFDIESVSDDFWAAKVAQFAPAPITVLVGRAVPIRITTAIEYIFNTELEPFLASVVLVCKTPDAGYEVGDQVACFGFGAYSAPAPYQFRDSSGVQVRMMIGNQAPWVSHKDTGVHTNIATGSWNLLYRLYC